MASHRLLQKCSLGYTVDKMQGVTRMSHFEEINMETHVFELLG